MYRDTVVRDTAIHCIVIQCIVIQQIVGCIKNVYSSRKRIGKIKRYV